MAKYKARFKLILSEDEVCALRDFLGNMTGQQYLEASGDCETTKEIVTGIYHALPQMGE